MPKTAKPVKAAKAAAKPAAKAATKAAKAKPAAIPAASRRSSGRVPNLNQPLDLSGFKFSKGAKAELAKASFAAGVAAFGPVGTKKVRK